MRWTNILIASIIFLGLAPLLIFYSDSMLAQGIIFLASILLYIAAEVGSIKKKSLCAVSNMLFLAILFLALGFLTRQWFDASWAAQLQLGFLMLSAIYYALAALRMADVWRFPNSF